MVFLGFGNHLAAEQTFVWNDKFILMEQIAYIQEKQFSGNVDQLITYIDQEELI